MARSDLLCVRGLTVSYAGAVRPALAGFDLDVAAGECVAVVGPSGSGKSTLCRALLDLLPPGATRSGQVAWQGRDLAAAPDAWRRLRGRGIGLVLQDHRHALDPVRRIGDQIGEVAARHHPDLDRAGCRDLARSLLAEVRLPDDPAFAGRYPHQLSGGQRQRVGLAAALAAGPELLLADEPTTALDLIVQRDIVVLLADLVRNRRLALLLVSHDRDLVDLLADRVVELEAGSAALPAGAPEPRAPAPAPAPCLDARGLTVMVPGPSGPHAVVHEVDLAIGRGEAFGLAGESGAGKTTLARALAGWLPVAAGTVELADTAGLDAGARRRAVQLVSQDPAAALDPRQTVLAAVVEAACAAGADGRGALHAARGLLADVDLSWDLADRFPATLSGGQRQRLQLARALAAEPRLLIADEPASSLDPRRRQGLLALLRRVQQRRGLALLIVSHDLLVLETWCDRVGVMLGGRLVELYRPGYVDGSRHPFARDLAAAVPARLSCLHGFGSPAEGELETNQQPPPNGCPYTSRCDLVQPACHNSLPDLRVVGSDHFVRCPEVDRHVR